LISVVHKEALFRALGDGTLFVAGLDVWYKYPADQEARSHTPPSAYPFHELANVVMSPHRAGHSDESEELRMTHLSELLDAAAQGQLMPNRVALIKGY
jgi:phosphoglycerate dehydrogenase-like enzyme